MRALGVTLSAFCMATVLAQVIGLGYLAGTGVLDRMKLARVLAVVHGLDLAPAASTTETIASQPVALSRERRTEMLEVRNGQLDLRERFIEGQQNVLDMERRKVAAEKERLAQEKEAFAKQRAAWEEGERAKGVEEVVQILSKISIDEAKKILLETSKQDMDRAVLLLRKLPDEGRKAKILDACTSGEEVKMRAEIIRRTYDAKPPLAGEEKSK